MSNPTYHNCRGDIHYWFKQNFFFCIFFPCLFLEEEMWTKAHIPGRQVREARSWDEDPADTGRKLNGPSQAALPLTSTHSLQTQALSSCSLQLFFSPQSWEHFEKAEGKGSPATTQYIISKKKKKTQRQNPVIWKFYINVYRIHGLQGEGVGLQTLSL